MPVELVETTVGELAGVRVGCGNFWDRSWRDPDGTERSGLSAKLAPFDREEDLVVGEGTRLEVGEVRWVVTAIHKATGELGRLQFEREESP